jgi:hypothetical protein
MIPSSPPTQIVIPDLVSHCPFKLRLNPACIDASLTSEKWLAEGCKLSEKKQRAFRGIGLGVLTSMCYPDAALPELQVCTDWMNCTCLSFIHQRTMTMLTRRFFGSRRVPSVRLLNQCWLPDAGMLTTCISDDITDDMDDCSETTLADLVMNALYHPFDFHDKASADVMTRRFV